MTSAVDLFAGAGGMSMGLELAGIKVSAAYEWWDKAVNIYNLNLVGETAVQRNLEEEKPVIDLIKKLSPDIIVGGPPCQDFSIAGSRVEGDRASLTISFANIVIGVSPSVFVMENVPNAKKSSAYKTARKYLKTAGYNLTELVLDAAYFGVPQHRKRLVVFGCREEFMTDIRNAVELEESILPLTVKQKYPRFPVNYYYRHPRTYSRRAIFSTNEPAPTVRGVNRPRPLHYKINPRDVSRDPNIRALTYQERALLQTFPANYEWGGLGKSDIEQMIGNAVPVEMAHHIGIVLNKVVSKNLDTDISFRQWLRTEKKTTDATADDVLSRLRRAIALMGTTDPMSLEIRGVHQQAQNEAMSRTAESQICRSISLYHEFKEMGNLM